MKIAIRYFSKSGNTKKLAGSISEAIGVEAKTIDSKLTEDVDILFLGSSVMASQPRKEVKQFISNIDVNVGKVVNFGTAASKSSTYINVKKLVENKGITMSDKEFHCQGSFVAVNKGRPNQSDLAEAAAFAKEVINN